MAKRGFWRSVDLTGNQTTDGGVIVLHNHPASTRPSWLDLKSVAANEFVKASLVLCHDGAIYTISGTSDQLIQARNDIMSEYRPRLLGEVPEENIEMMVLDELYRRNEVERWLRVKKL